MRYTLLAPSKRVRAVLVLLAADLCGTSARAMPGRLRRRGDSRGVAHARRSAAMDDAPLRARPACRAHRVRRGDHRFSRRSAAQPAFRALSRALRRRRAADADDAPQRRGRPRRSGRGQAEDVLATDAAINFDTLERIHRRKTGVLFSAAATAGR
jgi:geranylgeranyl pyrophosphate synthase